MEILKETERNQYKNIDFKTLKNELENIREFHILHNKEGWKQIKQITLTLENDIIINISNYWEE